MDWPTIQPPMNSLGTERREAGRLRETKLSVGLTDALAVGVECPHAAGDSTICAGPGSDLALIGLRSVVDALAGSPTQHDTRVTMLVA